MELEIIKFTGENTGRKVILSDSIFGIEPNDHAVYLDVKQYLANQRQGTHKSKERNEVAGSTKKIKKQKGTGGARAGSITSPVFRGGGRIFGPRPRDYSFKLNKKVKALARKSALTYKAKDNNISILEDFTFETPKTKSFIEMLSKLQFGNKKTLLVISEVNKNVVLSGRNIPNAKVVTVDQINTYELLNAEQLLFTEAAIGRIENLLN